MIGVSSSFLICAFDAVAYPAAWIGSANGDGTNDVAPMDFATAEGISAGAERDVATAEIDFVQATIDSA
jgi:hypothetical protein